MPIKPDAEGAAIAAKVVERNAALGVTWLHSYVDESKTKTFCIYDAPDPEAVRKAAERNGLPVDAITQVRVLDPYFNR
jgi:predicted amidohydrolase YtcJ